MRTVYEAKLAEAITTERQIRQGTAKIVSRKFGPVAKLLWPHKTSEQLASRVGCSVRAAAYEISGEREPSARSIRAVINEIIPER